MHDKYNIIDESKIEGLIHKYENPDNDLINKVLNKALNLKGLNLEDAAVLLNIQDEENLNKLFFTANKVKNEIYGNRLVLFAPLYVSNYCSNNCLYCGFRVKNKNINRIKLDYNQIEAETVSILEQGHKRVLLLMGENLNKNPMDYLVGSVDAVYKARDSKGSSIRRINLEIAPLDDADLKEISKLEIGTYTVFQETYHKDTYNIMHESGPKADYDFRLETMDRALSNGLHDIGIGALFGLYDYRFDVLGLLSHAEHLDKKFNVGPHTISIPRIKPASNAPASMNLKHEVSDRDFKKLIAVLRCSVPYTGMILSTREPADLRTEIFNLGVSQISAGSKTNPGGYKQALSDVLDGQFSLNDCRSSGEVIKDVIDRGFIPSFCTACYRLGRVGEDFMDIAKPGLIKTHCQPNGLCTLQEYLEDYADTDTIMSGENLIDKELEDIPKKGVKRKTIENIERIKNGERDLYF